MTCAIKYVNNDPALSSNFKNKIIILSESCVVDNELDIFNVMFRHVVVFLSYLNGKYPFPHHRQTKVWKRYTLIVSGSIRL